MGKFSKWLRSLDRFGQSPKLLYKGQDSYKTKLGAVITLCITLFVMTFSGQKIIRLATKSQPNTSMTESFENTTENFTKYNLNQNNFAVFALFTPKDWRSK